ncbi:MAG: hypothetical protein D6793_08725 [Thermoflexia bacterium]|nr:MAG: hypothetical protein D6793_08725 [Thermoflexia bacterium]
MEAYRRLREAQACPAWQDVLNQVWAFRARLQARRGGRPLLPPEEVVREIREEQDARLTGLP